MWAQLKFRAGQRPPYATLDLASSDPLKSTFFAAAW